MKKIIYSLFAFVLVVSIVGTVKAQSVNEQMAIDNATALTLTSSDGGIDGVLRGVSYTVVYDAFAGTSTVAPNNNGEAPNGDVGVDISGDVSANLTVEISLPDALLGTGGTSMPITFPGSGPGSGIRVETGGFFNPAVVNTFNLGLGGTANLRLGYIFSVPANTNISGDQYIGQILFNAYYTGL